MIYSLFLALYKQVTVSAKDRIEYPKNFLNSNFDCKIHHSEIFSAIESQARLICEVKLNISSFGNF
ncbi:hypothetical protein SAMN05880573_10290 [Chryseobacterium sp. RU33C]|nr:hypothetical protein SAMN05880573_10290 [Chryseobacterium sp. RU33C]